MHESPQDDFSLKIQKTPESVFSLATDLLRNIIFTFNILKFKRIKYKNVLLRVRLRPGVSSPMASAGQAEVPGGRGQLRDLGQRGSGLRQRLRHGGRFQEPAPAEAQPLQAQCQERRNGQKN